MYLHIFPVMHWTSRGTLVLIIIVLSVFHLIKTAIIQYSISDCTGQTLVN